MERTIGRIQEGFKENDFANDMYTYFDFGHFVKSGKEIMAHEPVTKSEKILKKLLEEAIETKVANFYCPVKSHSLFDEEAKTTIETEKMSDAHKASNWWEKTAKEYSSKSLFDEEAKATLETEKMSAAHKAGNWWEKTAKEYSSKCGNCQEGITVHEKCLRDAAMRGIFIQSLVEEKGLSVAEAWNKVCSDSINF